MTNDNYWSLDLVQYKFSALNNFAMSCIKKVALQNLMLLIFSPPRGFLEDNGANRGGGGGTQGRKRS